MAENKEDEIKSKLEDVVKASIKAYIIFGNEKEACAWMMAPNDYFFGSTPVDQCLISSHTVMHVLDQKSPKGQGGLP